MLGKISIAGIFTFTFAMFAQAGWIAESDRNSTLVLESMGKFQPEVLAYYGLSEFDGDITDLRPDVYQRQRAAYESLLQELQGREAVEEHPQVRQDLAILIQAIRDEIRSAEIERANLIPYYALHKELFQSFNLLLDTRNNSDRFPAALERLQKYTGKQQDYQPLFELAIARSTERFEVKGLVGPYVKELETDVVNAPRYIQGLREVFDRSGLEGWEEDFSRLEGQLERYNQWLSTEMLPRARLSNQLPAPVYANNLKEYGVYASPQDLIEKGQYSYQMIRNQMIALARSIAQRRGWKEQDLVAVMGKLKREQIPPERVLDVYKERLASVEEIIRREDLVTLPERKANIRLASEAESAAIPASFMRPPQLINNTGQHGEFVLVQTNPALGEEAQMDDWNHQAITWGLTVHEARPGHELQFAKLVENGTSLARAIFAANSANFEGWGLYAESIMQEYLPPEGQLFSLFMRALRAARMFLDPMVNTGQMTPEEVVTFLMQQLAVSRPMAVSEADRYAFDLPGQATAYYYGYMNLMRLRTEVELALGIAFDAREFHDYILAQGLLSPDLLREAVLEEFAR